MVEQLPHLSQFRDADVDGSAFNWSSDYDPLLGTQWNRNSSLGRVRTSSVIPLFGFSTEAEIELIVGAVDSVDLVDSIMFR